MPESLPVEQVLPDLLAALRSHGCAVLKAPPGAGKTTKVPPAILNDGLPASQQILMLEPRRIAARTAAARMAAERREQVGQTVGYRVRFEEAVSRQTRILVVTEGVLLRRLQDDPFLENVGVLIFDEFHERRLDSDLALAMALRVRNTVRSDLKLIAMSATLAPEPIADFLDQCPIIHSEGRQHPVKVRYLPRADRRPLPETMADGIQTALQDSQGHVLAFLPGLAEIHRTRDQLESTAKRHNLLLLPLYGDLPSSEQDRVLAPTSQRKVILATNVAETSITIDGVEAVVDSGLARQMQFDPSAGLDRLQLTPVSRASADQRAGRAGRTGPDSASGSGTKPHTAADLPPISPKSSALTCPLPSSASRPGAKLKSQPSPGLSPPHPKHWTTPSDSCTSSAPSTTTPSPNSDAASSAFPPHRESPDCSSTQPPPEPPAAPASSLLCSPNVTPSFALMIPATAAPENPSTPGACKTHAAMCSIDCRPSNAGFNTVSRTPTLAKFTAALPIASLRLPDSFTAFSAKKSRSTPPQPQHTNNPEIKSS